MTRFAGGSSTDTCRSGTSPAPESVASSAEELKQIAAVLEAGGRTDEVLEVLGEVAELDPSDMDVRAGLAQAYAGKGDLGAGRSVPQRGDGRLEPVALAHPG